MCADQKPRFYIYVTIPAKSSGKCLDTLAIVAAEGSAQVQQLVHDACVDHAYVKGRLHWQAVTWSSTLHKCTIIPECAEMQAWGCHICWKTPLVVATRCTVPQHVEGEVVAEAKRHAAEERKHKKQAAIAAKAALREQLQVMPLWWWRSTRHLISHLLGLFVCTAPSNIVVMSRHNDAWCISVPTHATCTSVTHLLCTSLSCTRATVTDFHTGWWWRWGQRQEVGSPCWKAK